MTGSHACGVNDPDCCTSLTYPRHIVCLCNRTIHDGGDCKLMFPENAKLVMDLY